MEKSMVLTPSCHGDREKAQQSLLCVLMHSDNKRNTPASIKPLPCTRHHAKVWMGRTPALKRSPPSREERGTNE